MPVICTKDQRRYRAFTTSRVLAKKHAENDSIETLKTFAVKDSSDTSRNPNFQAGATIPNSVVKGAHNKNPVSGNSNATVEESKNSQGSKEDAKIKDLEIIVEKREEKEEKFTSENIQTETKPAKKPEKTSSIVSGSEKLKELQELQKQLHKSYEPKPLFEPRRPTLDSIKSAIEKAKLEFERNKNVGTEEEKKSVVSVSDASTSTEKLKKKIIKKKKKETEIVPTPLATPSPMTSGTKKPKVKKKKKISVEVKLKTNIEKSPQP